MDTGRSEGKRTLRYKEEDDEEEEEEEEEEEINEMDYEEEYGRRKRVVNKRSGSSKGGSSMAPLCQADNCDSDLSEAKQYHRRHKVCEFHSKAPAVLIGGQQQRFCQQCSRFHELAEFDDSKRSCRKRLSGHNQRRRKNAAYYHGD